MQQDIAIDDLTQKGKMTKSPFEMSNSEYFAWQIRVQVEAREKLFSMGQPYVYDENGHRFAEFSDGRVEQLR